VGVEETRTAKLNASFPPSAGLEYSRRTTKSQQLPAATVVIDRLKSNIGSETPKGGIVWDYAIIQDPKCIEGFLELDVHHAQSVVPKSNPPSSIRAEVSTILDIRKDKPNAFTLFRRVRGFSVGYRHINIRTKVDVHWKDKDLAVFPTMKRTGHQLAITHRFKEDGYEIPPEEAKFDDIDHKLVVMRE